MLKRNGNYYSFISSTDVAIPVKYRKAIVNSAVKLNLWYVVGYDKKYVKVRIMPIKGDFKGVTKILVVIKKALNAVM